MGGGTMPDPSVMVWQENRELARRVAERDEILARIRDEARAELKRIEDHGGCAGFAGRVLVLAGGEEGE